jgi:hypothetical protein
MEEMRNAYKILVGESAAESPHAGSRHGREDNIKMNLMELGCKYVFWIYMAQERVQRT